MSDLEARLKALLTPNADGLLPCEKCGNSNETTLGVSRWGASANEVTCCCGVRGRTCYGADSREKAIDSWNHRPALRALVEAVKQRDESISSRDMILGGGGSGRYVTSQINREDAALLAILDGKEGT